jgi:hypothetical protein
MGSLRHVLAVAAAVALLMTLATSSALGSQSGTFTGLKDCGSFPNPPQCTITASSLATLRGAVVTYTAIVFFPDHLISPVTLAARGSGTATGQCTFYFGGPGVGHGHCDYWSGTGKLNGFHASLEVGTTSMLQADGVGYVNSLSGTYWFEREGDDD